MEWMNGKQIEVLSINIFLDTDLHLSGNADFNSKIFNENKVKKVLEETLSKLYKCGTGTKKEGD